MALFDDLPLRRKLTLVFVSLICVVGLMGMIVTHEVGIVHDTVNLNQHTYQVLDQVALMTEGMVNQETGTRGYLISGDTGFLDPVTSGRRQFEQALSTIRELTMDNAAQQARLEQVQAVAGKWRREVSEKEIALMGAADTVEQARTLEASGAGKASMDGFRAIVTEVANAEKTLLAQRQADQDRAMATSNYTLWGGVAAIIVISVIFGMLLSSSIGRPIAYMTQVMEKLAAGDLTATVAHQSRRDEVGAMAAAVQVFKANIERNQELSTARDEDNKSKDRRTQVVDGLVQDFDRAAAALLHGMTSAASQMETTAQAMASTAERTTKQAATVSSATDMASANVQTVASAAEELSASISEIGQQVEKAAQAARLASTEAGQTDITVRELAEAAGHIGDVVLLINDIASQTNLLALNATIDAARAGDAGKGFAVVANEVKSLANQTAKATEDIGQQVGAVQTATQQVVRAIAGIVSRIGEINNISSAIAAAVEEQSAATGEIADNANRAAQGTQQVAENIVGVTSAASETGSAAQQVLGASRNLAGQTKDMADRVKAFLDGIRAA